jgi:ribosomal protein S18 acetylase RimI-like enzyme
VPDISIREVRIEDHPALDALWSDADLIHHGALPTVFARPAGVARSIDFVKSSLSDSTKQMLVAVAQDRVVGVVRLTIRERQPPFVPRRFATVEEIVVSAEHRGEGIGQRLMAEAEAWAANNGADEVWLDVWEFNESAIGFYASLGYETITLRMRKEVEPAPQSGPAS